MIRGASRRQGGGFGGANDGPQTDIPSLAQIVAADLPRKNCSPGQPTSNKSAASLPPLPVRLRRSSKRSSASRESWPIWFSVSPPAPPPARTKATANKTTESRRPNDAPCTSDAITVKITSLNRDPKGSCVSVAWFVLSAAICSWRLERLLLPADAASVGASGQLSP